MNQQLQTILDSYNCVLKGSFRGINYFVQFQQVF